MLNGRKIVVVMPAYNAAATLEQTVAGVPADIVDEIILVDDASSDDTHAVAERLGLHTIRHERNLGYGGNQKTCYRAALQRGADVVVMVHPDYQYSPRLIASLAGMVAYGEYDACLGSRILGGSAWSSSMPRWKYVANRALTLIQNLLLNAKLSEYHSGFRAFSRELLLDLPLEANSNDFVFDNQMLAQILFFGYRLGEISCPSRYFAEASSIRFRRAVRYGLGVLQTSIEYRLARWAIRKPPILTPGRNYLEVPGPVAASGDESGRPVAASQTRAVPSQLAVTTRRPSASNDT